MVQHDLPFGDDPEIPDEDCPACGRRARLTGWRKRLAIWACTQCDLVFEVLSPCQSPDKNVTSSQPRASATAGSANPAIANDRLFVATGEVGHNATAETVRHEFSG